MKEIQLGPTISRFGLLGGLILSLIFLITTITGLTTSGSTAVGVFSFVIQLAVLIAIIIIGIKKQRDELQEGYISLGQCVLLGTGIIVLAVLIMTVVTIVYTNFIDPTYMEKLTEMMEQKWEEQGLSEEQIESAKSMTGMMKNPILISTVTVACWGFGGAILSLIVGLIMKRDKPEFS